MTTVLTLRLDAGSQEHFERLRRLYYPPERNQIPAHLTLFHTLPGEADVVQVLEREAGAQEPFSLRVTGVMSLGRGAAYRLEGTPLMELHARLRRSFAEHLTGQDRQALRPHIVVQNKATAAAAGDLVLKLEEEFAPMEVQAVGLDLWEYLGGPWRLAKTLPFGAGLEGGLGSSGGGNPDGGFAGVADEVG